MMVSFRSPSSLRCFYAITNRVEDRRCLERGVLSAPLRVYTSPEIGRWYEPLGPDPIVRVIHQDTLTAFSLSPDEPRPFLGGALEKSMEKAIEDMVSRNWFSSSKTVEESIELMCTAIVKEPIPIEKTGRLGRTMSDTFPFFDSNLGISREDQALHFYFSLSAEKLLPKDFDQWSMTLNGKTLAHDALERGCLPPDFDQWALCDANKVTVAHHAASKRKLPPHFNQWTLCEKGGWSVAHECAHSGWLPDDFALWDLSDNSGVTILDIVRSRRDLDHLFKQYEAWKEAGSLKSRIAEPASFLRTPSFIRRGF